MCAYISSIGYPPEQYCQQTECDANNIAATIADYFANPLHTTLPTIKGDSKHLGYVLNSREGQNIAWVTGEAKSTITIVVQDGSGQCPDDYQQRFPEWDSGKYTKKWNEYDQIGDRSPFKPNPSLFNFASN